VWIRFYAISGLTIEGGGVIDGQGQDWWSKSCKVNKQQVRVPFNCSVSPHRCAHVAAKNWVVLLNHTKGFSHLPNKRCTHGTDNLLPYPALILQVSRHSKSCRNPL